MFLLFYSQDLICLPLLVRRNNVVKALEWLKLNHVDYKYLEISYENLERYPEDTPPVSVEYRCENSNKVPEVQVHLIMKLMMVLQLVSVLSLFMG